MLPVGLVEKRKTETTRQHIEKKKKKRVNFDVADKKR